MDTIKKGLILDNLVLIAAMFTACLRLSEDITSMLEHIQYAHDSIKEVTFSYYDVTVYTNSETFHLPLWLPLVISGVGIVYNLIYSLIKYIKGE